MRERFACLQHGQPSLAALGGTALAAVVFTAVAGFYLADLVRG